MPATPIHGLRYPADTDTPDVPRDIRQLAEDTESALASVKPDVLIGPAASRPATLAVGQIYYGY